MCEKCKHGYTEMLPWRKLLLPMMALMRNGTPARARACAVCSAASTSSSRSMRQPSPPYPVSRDRRRAAQRCTLRHKLVAAVRKVAGHSTAEHGRLLALDLRPARVVADKRDHGQLQRHHSLLCAVRLNLVARKRIELHEMKESARSQRRTSATLYPSEPSP